MEESQKKKNIIDLREVASKIWHNKKLFFKVWVVTFVLASAWVSYSSQLSGTSDTCSRARRQ